MFGDDDDDYWEEIRSRSIPVIHDVLEKYGGYAEMDADKDEYLATVEHGPEEFEEYLAKWGFQRNPVAALKTRWDGETEIGSWRRCYAEENGEIVAGGKSAKWQLHVRLYPGPEDGTVDVHAHWEINWAHHPVKHYRGEDNSVEEGHRRMRSFLDNLGDDMYYDRQP